MFQRVYRYRQVFAGSAGSAKDPQLSAVFDTFEERVCGMLRDFMLESAAGVSIISGMLASPGLSCQNRGAVCSTILSGNLRNQQKFGDNQSPNQSSEATPENHPFLRLSLVSGVPHL